MNAYLTAALYHFAELPDFALLQAPLRAVCEQGGVKGTLLLALEGINGTIAGPETGVRAVLGHLRADPRLAKLVHKESWSDKEPFHRLKVKLKKEIVTLGEPEVVPSRLAGTYVKPADWNALISDPEVLVVDTRNDYEVAIGSFANAVDPNIKTFTELKDWVRDHTHAPGVLDGKRKVAMFCTGGIRCEKSTAYLRLQGFDEVYHLEGGILKYLEEVPPEQSLWQGECFVFDERVSVGHGLKPGPYEPCRSCRWPLSSQDKASPLYVKGVSCPRCHDRRTPEEKVRLAERQRQVELAEARGERHVGATMPQVD